MNTFPQLNAALIFPDQTVFFGYGVGVKGIAIGEICFNTSMTGYQEIITDPSYCGQIITFTTPHIGNTGINSFDTESDAIYAKGIILHEMPTSPSSYRSEQSFTDWLTLHQVTGICGVDTRAITKKIRQEGACNVAIAYASNLEEINVPAIIKLIEKSPSMDGCDLAKGVSCHRQYQWTQTLWKHGAGPGPYAPLIRGDEGGFGEFGKRRNCHNFLKIVVIDYGVKKNILRCLADLECDVIVVPAMTTAEEVLSYNPAGIVLSNGPGDPAATGIYALPMICDFLKAGIPIFGICLGHQMLGLALGCRTEKMRQGHRGANHPICELASGKVSITSQNHGFVISDSNLPDDVEITHRSLFDGTIQGFRSKTYPAFGLQGHPEASPGPHDLRGYFSYFINSLKK